MSKLIHRILLSPLALLALGTIAKAATAASTPAHTHGEARVTLIYQQRELLVELSSPAANFLGFEHRPQTPEQRQALERLAQILAKPNSLVSLEPACKLAQSEVELPFKAEDSSAVEGHRHDDDGKHASKGGDAHKHQDTHQDVHTRYTWRCSSVKAPVITFLYFDRFARFSKLDVEWVINDQQGAAELSNAKNTLEIAQ